ncbi:MAG: hypothetical protein OXU23_26410 [Candidatus Poribacteria bacterium]|nr:hypothetical protein [Candidatus Poribacteria bacterium]
MIRLKRSRSKKDIHPNFYGKKKRTFEKELLLNQWRIIRGKIQKHTFNSNGWIPAKKQLLVETGGKCAYCEAKISAVAFGDVEHYRPKSSYWWLAYCYDNYLASCQLCNQRFKKDAFPIQNRRMPQPIIWSAISDEFITAITGAIAPDPLNKTQVDAFIRRHEQERPLLLNPYFDDPSGYFAWRADDVLREVEITTNPENPHVEIVVNAENREVEPIAAASIEYYGLNRKELKDHRYTIYRLYSIYRQTLEDDRLISETRNSNITAIEAMKAPGAEFAGMIRYFDEFFSKSER